MPPDFEGSQTAAQRTPRWRTLIVLAAALAALFVAELVWTSLRQSHQPTGQARWIWSGPSSRYSPPEAFYALRDFDLDESPEEATLLAQGDEEYIVYLNGRAVGSNRYVMGAQLDRYDVASFLRPGRNRIVAHLRSATADGGFLAVLHAGLSSEPIVVTDESWQISRHRTPRIMDPFRDVEWPSRAVVVADPPAGRWGATSDGVERPLLRELLRPGESIRAKRVRLADEEWSGRGRRRFARGAPFGAEVIFDFGRQHTGILTLRFEPGEPAVGLVYLGLELPDPAARQPETAVIVSRGERLWVDAVPRTFRYALVVGLDQLTGARIARTDAGLLSPIVAGDTPVGVFGLEAPRLRSPVENVVWGELESLAGEAAGQSR